MVFGICSRMMGSLNDPLIKILKKIELPLSEKGGMTYETRGDFSVPFLIDKHYQDFLLYVHFSSK